MQEGEIKAKKAADGDGKVWLRKAPSGGVVLLLVLPD